MACSRARVTRVTRVPRVTRGVTERHPQPHRLRLRARERASERRRRSSARVPVVRGETENGDDARDAQ